MLWMRPLRGIVQGWEYGFLQCRLKGDIFGNVSRSLSIRDVRGQQLMAFHTQPKVFVQHLDSDGEKGTGHTRATS
jgi:hypothetical protein